MEDATHGAGANGGPEGWRAVCTDAPRASRTDLRGPERLELPRVERARHARRAAQAAAGARRPLVRRCRGQRLALHADRARDLSSMGRPDSARVPVYREGSPLRNALQAAVGLR